MLTVVVVVAGLLTTPAQALQYNQGRYGVTLEGFGNLAGGYASGDEEIDDDIAGFGFGELRLLALADTGHDLVIGPRVTYRGLAGDNTDDSALFGERSLILLGSWGRLEFGERRGLPDVLTGYAPNNYQFVSAEYGPASGPSLDPDGGLQTALIDSALAAQIAPLSGLGITADFFFDESLKVIYVGPKTKGFLPGISYAPHIDGGDGRFDDLIQTGLTWEHYSEQNILRVGGTYTYADGQQTNSGATRTDDLHSFSLGASATLDYDLTLGASFTYNGDTGLTRSVGLPISESAAYGYAASVNYNKGPWTVGGFIQTARAEGATNQAGDDQLHALQGGVSYRTSTNVRYFAAVYLYEFDDEAGNTALANQDGVAALVRTRLNF
ncbi:MAG: hypothetical protein H0V34_07100 [Gammaproteobacteria bacterium]|nr:hypothetical protein [Gammaproteobacteria bacterium]